MEKSEAIREILSKIYSRDTTVILSKKETDSINKYYGKNFNKYKGYTQFLEADPEIHSIILKVNSIEKEIHKQFANEMGLQQGILSECNYIQTLAKLFGLNKCVDLDQTPANQLPVSCTRYIRQGADKFSCSRYLYYSARNEDVFIFQYGNPSAGDADIIFCGMKVYLEVKERSAKCGEFDLTYDEKGHLIYSKKIEEKYPDMIKLIDAFNEETTVFEQIGSNYNKFDPEIVEAIISNYFNQPQIDLLISTDNNDKLIAVQSENINLVLPNGKKIISTDTSEIRTAGRNSGKVFTPGFLDKTLDDFDAIEIEPGKYMIENRNDRHVGFAKGRGKDEITRFKINHVFFVPVKQIEEDGEYVIFEKKDIKQLKASISMHISVSATKEEIKEAIL